MVKNLPANAGDIRDMGWIARLGRFPGVGMATHSSILAWRIPWKEEAGRATFHWVTESEIAEAT